MRAEAKIKHKSAEPFRKPSAVKLDDLWREEYHLMNKVLEPTMSSGGSKLVGCLKLESPVLAGLIAFGCEPYLEDSLGVTPRYVLLSRLCYIWP